MSQNKPERRFPTEARQWSDEEIQSMRIAWLEGLTLADVGAKFNCGGETVRRLMRAHCYKDMKLRKAAVLERRHRGQKVNFKEPPRIEQPKVRRALHGLIFDDMPHTVLAQEAADLRRHDARVGRILAQRAWAM